MSILGRCLLLPFPVAMFVDCLFPGIDDRFTGMLMSFIVGCHRGMSPDRRTNRQRLRKWPLPFAYI